MNALLNTGERAAAPPLLSPAWASSPADDRFAAGLGISSSSLSIAMYLFEAALIIIFQNLKNLIILLYAQLLSPIHYYPFINLYYN